MSYDRDPAEYREQLATQVRHLRRSASYFDDRRRKRGPAPRRDRSHARPRPRPVVSLLTHLGVKDTLRYVDTAPRMPPGAPPGAIMLHAGLVIVHAVVGPAGGSARFVPPLADVPGASRPG